MQCNGVQEQRKWVKYTYLYTPTHKHLSKNLKKDKLKRVPARKTANHTHSIPTHSKSNIVYSQDNMAEQTPNGTRPRSPEVEPGPSKKLKPKLMMRSTSMKTNNLNPDPALPTKRALTCLVFFI